MKNVLPFFLVVVYLLTGCNLSKHSVKNQRIGWVRVEGNEAFEKQPSSIATAAIRNAFLKVENVDSVPSASRQIRKQTDTSMPKVVFIASNSTTIDRPRVSKVLPTKAVPFFRDRGYHYKARSDEGQSGGWPGIVSFICSFIWIPLVSAFDFGVTSFLVSLLLPVTLILAAIVLGIIGCSRHRRMKGFAIAGLAIALSYIFIFALLVLAFGL